MFIYSLKASTLKFTAVVCVALVALIALIAFVPTYASDGTSAAKTSADVQTNETAYRYDGVKTAENAADFLSQFGITVDRTPTETQTVTIPDKFDKVFAGYNEIQKSQGLDLSKYKGKTVTRYTFTVKNYPDWDGTVYANVLVYRNKVIGGDICSADVSGFVKGFSGQ